MIFKKALSMLISGLASFCCFGQSNIVSVDNFRGTALCHIPIANLSSGSISTTVGLAYATNGVKVKDVEQNAGMGWRVSAGGQISRERRGLPDDCKKDISGNNRLGWLYNSNGTAIESFTILNTGGSGSCSNANTDLNYLNTNFSDLSDTEPDIFTVSAPGLSVQFAFDKNHLIKTLTRQDLKITYTADGTSGLITYFQIINDQGTKYLFNLTNLSTRRSVGVGNADFSLREANQFRNGIQSSNEWYLTSMQDISGNTITFNYDSDASFFSGSAVIVKTGTNDSQSFSESRSTFKLVLIQAQTGLCLINYNTKNLSTERSTVSSILANGVTYDLNYSAIQYYNSDQLTNYTRLFLRNVTTRDCNSPIKYDFRYNGEVLDSNKTVIPDSLSQRVDRWGYANNYSSSPEVNPAYVAAGTLKQVLYSNNGSTTISYEPNEYYNARYSSVVTGGGVRVSKIINYDGIDSANNVVKQYSYLDPATSQTSGKILWEIETSLSPYIGASSGQDDLSPDGFSVIYTYVRERLPGYGSKLYQYTTPGTYWDAGTYSNWAPTLAYHAVTNCTAYPSVYTFGYPFAPNPNYDHERGLVKSILTYNESGNKVAEDQYTYQSATPVVISALKFEESFTSKNYSRYSLLTGADNSLTQIEKKIFDAPSYSTAQTTTTNFYYSSANHNLLTKQESVNSDGSTIREFTKYAKDYDLTAGTTSSTTALYNLQQQNRNLAVEKYTQVERASVNKTIKAEILLFKGFDVNVNGGLTTLYMPSSRLTLMSTEGLSDFQASTASGGIFSKDSRYICQENYLLYDNRGILKTSDDNRHKTYTTLTDARLFPYAKAVNASATEISYKYEGSNELSLPSGTPIGGTIKKQALANRNIFSVWLKSSSSGAATVTLTNSSSQSFTYTFPVDNSSSKWKYYEISVPLTSMNDDFNFSLSCNITVTVNNMLFYPDGSELITYEYDPDVRQVTRETNSNGISAYNTYDKYGRLLTKLNQDRDIVLRKTYVSIGNSSIAVPKASIQLQDIDNSWHWPPGLSGRFYTSSAIGFYITQRFQDCDNPQFTWNFGDGTTPIVTTSYSPVSHSYSTAGDYTITLTVTSSNFATQTVTTVLSNIETKPAPNVPVYFTNYTDMTVYNVKFYQGNVEVYSFTPSDFGNGVSVPKGVYRININTGPAENNCYGSITISDGNGPLCQQYECTGSYAFESVNWTNSTESTITINTTPCQ